MASAFSVKCTDNHPGCPWDSSIKFDANNNGCCQDNGHCQCNQSICDLIQTTTCDPGYFERITVKQGNGRPGSCCNLTVCRRKSPRTVDMPDVICPTIDITTLTCPADSIQFGEEMSSDLCLLGVVCQCQPCKYSCEEGYYPSLLTHGTGIPGDCCHSYVCKKDENFCIAADMERKEGGYYKEKSYSSGHKRKISECEYALCTNGRWSFEHVTCKSDKLIGANCVHVDGECCPVCFPAVDQGIKLGHCQVGSGRHSFPDGTVWRAGDCVVCHCVRGVIYCARPECSESSCILPVKVKGECCPICVHQYSPSPTTSTTAVATVDACHYKGVSYPAGSNWTLDCKTCSCGEDRQVSCQTLQCPLLQNNHGTCNSSCPQLNSCDGDIVLVKVPHSCCPQCYNTSALPALKKQICRVQLLSECICLLLVLPLMLSRNLTTCSYKENALLYFQSTDALIQ